jgi:hypothetical protein
LGHQDRIRPLPAPSRPEPLGAAGRDCGRFPLGGRSGRLRCRRRGCCRRARRQGPPDGSAPWPTRSRRRSGWFARRRDWDCRPRPPSRPPTTGSQRPLRHPAQAGSSDPAARHRCRPWIRTNMRFGPLLGSIAVRWMVPIYGFAHPPARSTAWCTNRIQVENRGCSAQPSVAGITAAAVTRCGDIVVP